MRSKHAKYSRINETSTSYAKENARGTGKIS